MYTHCTGVQTPKVFNENVQQLKNEEQYRFSHKTINIQFKLLG